MTNKVGHIMPQTGMKVYHNEQNPETQNAQGSIDNVSPRNICTSSCLKML